MGRIAESHKRYRCFEAALFANNFAVFPTTEIIPIASLRLLLVPDLSTPTDRQLFTRTHCSLLRIYPPVVANDRACPVASNSA